MTGVYTETCTGAHAVLCFRRGRHGGRWLQNAASSLACVAVDPCQPFPGRAGLDHPLPPETQGPPSPRAPVGGGLGRLGSTFWACNAVSLAFPADTPIEEFTPTPAFPALQYLESVDEGGVAWQAGLRTGDFLIEVGTQVSGSFRLGRAPTLFGLGSVVSAAWLAGAGVEAALDRSCSVMSPTVGADSCRPGPGAVFEALAVTRWSVGNPRGTWPLI